MPGPGRDFQIRLYRDSLTTPWGFRLSGGKDLKAPLTVQKVGSQPVGSFKVVAVLAYSPHDINILARRELIVARTLKTRCSRVGRVEFRTGFSWREAWAQLNKMSDVTETIRDS